MIRPTKHPKTGIYRVRLAIPAHLRRTAKELFGRSAEFIENLGTKDCAEAKVRAAEASARLSARLAAVRAVHGETDAKLTERQVQALAGIWYAREEAKWADDPGSVEQWEKREFVLLDQLETQGDHADPETWTQVVVVSERDRSDAVELLAAQGMTPTQEAVGRVAAAIWEAKWALSKAMLQRARGDWSEETNRPTFPTLPKREAVAASGRPIAMEGGGCTLDALLEGWALDRGWRVDMRPQLRALYDRLRTAERLAAFLGHRIADAVTKDDAVRWKEEMQRRNLHAATIRNDISEMSAIWKWGIANGKLKSNANPFLGILPPKQKRRKAVRAFTDQEAASILLAARKADGSLRWLPWLLCLTGTRLNEVCQAVKSLPTVTPISR